MASSDFINGINGGAVAAASLLTDTSGSSGAAGFMVQIVPPTVVLVWTGRIDDVDGDDRLASLAAPTARSCRCCADVILLHYAWQGGGERGEPGAAADIL